MGKIREKIENFSLPAFIHSFTNKFNILLSPGINLSLSKCVEMTVLYNSFKSLRENFCVKIVLFFQKSITFFTKNAQIRPFFYFDINFD